MQIHVPDTEEYIDVISTLIIGDSKDYSIIYKTIYGDFKPEECDDIDVGRNFMRTIVILENMIKNNKYIKFNIEIK